jgi:hypothetical protein
MTTINQAGSATGTMAPRLTTTIVVCAFLSGFAALLYEVAWLRQLAIVFGSSALALVTVVAAYLTGRRCRS